MAETNTKKAENSSKRAVRKTRTGLRQAPRSEGRQPVRKTVRSAKKPVKSALRIIPLGGLNEIGKNMTAIEYGEDIIVIDCGSAFPDNDLLGIDLVIPDVTYLEKNLSKVKGIFLTHAHEDHIGSLPYVLRTVKAPIFCTPLTAEMVKLKLSEHKNLGKIKISVCKAGSKVKAGCFEVEFIHVNHSVPDSCAFAVRTPAGMIVHTGDFKIDSTPVDSEMTDLVRLGQLGREGVTLLLCESTNAERAGFSMSEKSVGEAFDAQFKGCDKRIVVATFASNVHRISQIISIAEKYGRKVVITGRSMEKIEKLAAQMGYVHPAPGTVVGVDALKKLTPEKTVILTTGSQGEPLSGLYRMAFAGHKQVTLGPDDKVLISASPIPGNEKQVFSMINELYRRGCDVVYNRLADLHVSGHACREELKIMMALIKPKYFMPIHGEYRHLIKNAAMAAEVGVDKKNIFVSAVGKPLEITSKGARFGAEVPSGKVLVDGTGIGDVKDAVLKERTSLSQSGMVIVSVAVSREGSIVAGPDITMRGFIHQAESEEFMRGLRKAAEDAIFSCVNRNRMDSVHIRSSLERGIEEYMYKKTNRTPMIVPLVMDC